MNTSTTSNLRILAIQPADWAGSGIRWTVKVAATVNGVACAGLYEFKMSGLCEEVWFEPEGIYGYCREVDGDDFLDISDGVTAVRISTDDFFVASSTVREFAVTMIDDLEAQIEEKTLNLIERLVA